MPFAPEFEMATLDAVAGEITRASKHALLLGTPCPNCTTPLKGPFCFACGQEGEKYDRSIGHLVGEAFEGLTHLDGRVWNTLPKLAVRPGGLTRAYLDGHRASQIPPFRIFLVALLLVFFAGGLNLQATNQHLKVRASDLHLSTKADLSAQDKADLAETAGKLSKAALGEPVATPGDRASAAGNQGWWQEQQHRIQKDPEVFLRILEEWGHRFAILMLPIAALILSVLLAFKKNTYVFDHLIFSMHSLSAQGFLLTTCFLGGIGSGWTWQLLWLSPVHLFLHMRGTYGTSVFGTLIRMFLLFIASSIAVAVLLLLLLFVGVATMR